MSRRSFVHVVCSPRPRVGKTLVARTLVDYFLAGDRTPSAFDTNSNEPSLADHFPAYVKVTDVRTVQGQVLLFDSLLVPDEVPKVVDLWHRTYDQFFDLVEEIGFIEEARKKSVEPIVFFIDGKDPGTDEAHQQLRERLPGVMIVSVHNSGATGAAPPAEHDADSSTPFPFEPQLHIPLLDPILKRALDQPGLALGAFLRDPPTDVSIVVRAAVRAWVSKVFVQLQNFELRLSLSDAQYLR